MDTKNQPNATVRNPHLQPQLEPPGWTQLVLPAQAAFQQDVKLLSQSFSHKPHDRIWSGYEAEAKAVLRASVSELAVRHAIISLCALRECIQTHGNTYNIRAESTASFRQGLQHYNKAVTSLVGKLSYVDRSSVESALLCCQLFISIEVLQKNFASAVQHFIHGMKIMNDYHIRPTLNEAGHLVLPQHQGLPQIDSFVIKLFSMSCSQEQRDSKSNQIDSKKTRGSPSHSSSSPKKNLMEDPIVCQTRDKLGSIAIRTLDYIDRISRVDTINAIPALIAERKHLIEDLELWYREAQDFAAQNVLVAASKTQGGFLFIFYSILRAILKASLHYSKSLNKDLEVDFERMLKIATTLMKLKNQHLATTN